MLVRFAARGAQPTASVASSIDSTDSYNRDDAQHYLYEWDEALGHHWEATQEIERLEATLPASQTALTAIEGESSTTPARLADSDARVAGRILKRNPAPLSFAPLCSSW